MEYSSTPSHYRVYLFTYGILSVLMVLEYYESKENYSECQKIIDAIRDQERRLDIKLFTRINNDTIKEVVDNYKNFNLTGKNAIENSEFYSDLIIREIELKHSQKAESAG